MLSANRFVGVSKKARRMLARAVVSVIIVGTASIAVAAEDPALAPATAPPAGLSLEQRAPKGRVLNGHVFVPSSTVPGALITTSFASYLVLGIGSTSGRFEVGDRVFENDYSYAGVGGALAFEWGFLPNFSARITIIEAIYSGIDGPSAITVGTTLQTGGTLGLTASLPVGEKLRLGFLVDAGIAPGLALTIGNGLQSVIDSCEAGQCTVEPGETFAKENAFTVQPALAANWAPWRSLGVTANVSYLYAQQDRTNENVDAQAVILGVAADYDFRTISSVPIALAATFAWTAPVGGEGLQHISDVGGGIYYTGRDHLAAGVQFVLRDFSVQEDLASDFSTVLSTVGLRYYW